MEPALSNWESPNYPTSICPGSTRSNGIDLASDPLVTGKLFDDTARYTLTKFTFNGTKFYGGTATFLVKGEKLSSGGDIQATAFVEKTVDIKPKNCGAPLNGNPTNSGFPGLLGKTIDMSEANTMCDPSITNEQMGKVWAFDNTTRLDPEAIAYPCGLIARSLFNDTY